MSTNPFENDVDTENDNEKRVVDEGATTTNSPQNLEFENLYMKQGHGAYDAIAKRLLADNFMLTALEFHAELMESGRELRRLRDYFSNPVHFETAGSGRTDMPGSLPRTSSAQTLDSLDFTHYSDEADRQAEDRVAVLEFELRKAQDTIRGLRDQLTIASGELRTITRDGESSDTLMSTSGFVPSLNSRHSVSNLSLRPHEKRAINFLVHEYLLQHEHKLTAVTFSDEVDDQDFEVWDDVGLNLPRPPDLAAVYREFYHRSPNAVQTQDACCSTDFDDDHNLFPDSDVNDQGQLLNKLNAENSMLFQRNSALESEIETLTADVRSLKCKLDQLQLSNYDTAVSASDDCISSTVDESVTPSEANASSRNVPKPMKDSVLRLIYKGSTVAEKRAKQEELISLVLTTAALHYDAKMRDQLLSLYFNMIKKPDDDQRWLLLHGAVQYAKSVGAVRTETELLPQCWEQMNHKHDERRLLIAEICGAVAPYLPSSIVSSLILSMLQQMLAEDKSELVREAVIRSLAVICNFIEEREKFQQILDLMQKALVDQSDLVNESAKTVLIPCVAYWAFEIGQLESGLLFLFVKRISQLITTNGVNQAANEQLLCTYFDCLRNMTVLLFWWILRSGPFSVDAQQQDNLNIDETRFPSSDGLLDNLAIFSPNKAVLLSLTVQYDEHTSREWFHTWDALDHVLKDTMSHLITALLKLDVPLPKAIHAAVNYFRHFSRVFGRGATVTKLRPLFTTAMNYPKENSENLDAFAVSAATTAIYAAGVLSAYQTDSDKKDLKTFLQTSIVSVARANCSNGAVLAAFAELSSSFADSDFILSVVWDLIVHKLPSVRRQCALILSRLVRSMNETCLKNRLIPCLITLASDRDSTVRSATIAGFGSALETGVARDDLTEKIRMQLSSMLDEPHSEVTTHILRMFAQLGPTAEPKFRDEFVIPQLALVCAKNSVSANAELKSAVVIGLFEAYSALSCCYLPAAVATESFLPGLKNLVKELDVERARIANSIIKDIENKLLANSVEKKPVGSTEMAVDEMKSRMMTKFRDLKDRMDQHKENVPSLFKKK